MTRVAEGFAARDTGLFWRLVCPLARLTFRLLGWEIASRPPALDRYVLIGAPHTSNWDFLYMLGTACNSGMQPRWMAKDSLFRWPIGRLHRWMGGIEVDRSRPGGLVAQAVEAFAAEQPLVLLIPPEGTRGRGEHWRSGFYHIAHGAGVPVVPAYMDYPSKVVGFGPPLMPTGSIERDMAVLREFYRGKRGKYPENASEVRLRSQGSPAAGGDGGPDGFQP